MIRQIFSYLLQVLVHRLLIILLDFQSVLVDEVYKTLDGNQQGWRLLMRHTYKSRLGDHWIERYQDETCGGDLCSLGRRCIISTRMTVFFVSDVSLPKIMMQSCTILWL